MPIEIKCDSNARCELIETPADGSGPVTLLDSDDITKIGGVLGVFTGLGMAAIGTSVTVLGLVASSRRFAPASPVQPMVRSMQNDPRVPSEADAIQPQRTQPLTLVEPELPAWTRGISIKGRAAAKAAIADVPAALEKNEWYGKLPSDEQERIKAILVNDVKIPKTFDNSYSNIRSERFLRAFHDAVITLHGKKWFRELPVERQNEVRAVLLHNVEIVPASYYQQIDETEGRPRFRNVEFTILQMVQADNTAHIARQPIGVPLSQADRFEDARRSALAYMEADPRFVDMNDDTRSLIANLYGNDAAAGKAGMITSGLPVNEEYLRGMISQWHRPRPVVAGDVTTVEGPVEHQSHAELRAVRRVTEEQRNTRPKGEDARGEGKVSTEKLPRPREIEVKVREGMRGARAPRVRGRL